jgi:hypothetical protein
LGETLAHSNFPIEKIAFHPNPFPYPISAENLHALTLAADASRSTAISKLSKFFRNYLWVEIKSKN